MKTILSVLLVLFVASSALAQFPDVKYTPVTLSGGTTMSLRASATTLDDTTQAFRIAGFSKVYIHIVTSVNDSSSTLLAYSVSNDGATFGAFTLFDSLRTTGTVGANKAFELPAGAMGGEYVRIRVYGTNDAIYSAAATTKITTVIRKKY